MVERAPRGHPPEAQETVRADRVVPLPVPSLDDRALLAQLLEGRPAAFRELFDRYGKMARGALVRVLGSETDAEDLVQETLLIVVRRCGTLRDPEALRSFVYSVAVRVARNELRKRAIRQWIPLRDAPIPSVTVLPHDTVATDAVRRIYTALNRLDSNLRIAFILRFVEGHEIAEGAELCGCSVSTFKRRLALARSRFEAAASRDPALSAWLENGGQT